MSQSMCDIVMQNTSEKPGVGKNIEILNLLGLSFNIPLIMQVLHFPRCTEWHNAG